MCRSYNGVFDRVNILQTESQPALPHDQHAPTGPNQFCLLSSVSLDVSPELFLPEFDVRLRSAGVKATCVSVPVAAMDEDRQAVLG